jgi:hypothetical protein
MAGTGSDQVCWFGRRPLLWPPDGKWSFRGSAAFATEPRPTKSSSQPAKALGSGSPSVDSAIVDVQLRQQGRHDRDLGATEHRRCGRPQADLGHPESDIATDEAIHRSTGCEIAQNVLCGARLVGCGEEWKACDEAFVSGGRGDRLGGSPGGGPRLLQAVNSPIPRLEQTACRPAASDSSCELRQDLRTEHVNECPLVTPDLVKLRLFEADLHELAQPSHVLVEIG